MKTINMQEGFKFKTSRSKNSEVKIKKVEVSKIPSVQFSENVNTIVLTRGNMILSYDRKTKTLRKLTKVSGFYAKNGIERFIEQSKIENLSVEKSEDLLQYI